MMGTFSGRVLVGFPGLSSRVLRIGFRRDVGLLLLGRLCFLYGLVGLIVFGGWSGWVWVEGLLSTWLRVMGAILRIC